MKKNLYHVSVSPHLQSPVGVPGIMYSFIYALIPTTLAGIYYFGFRALIVILLCVGSAILSEMAMRRLMGRPDTIKDGNAALIGLLLALVMPPGVPWWLCILGAVVAIVLGKQIYGGLGNNPFNPVAVGWVILRISYPEHMAKYFEPSKIWGGLMHGWEIASPPLALVRGDLSEVFQYTNWQLFWGDQSGAIGEVFIAGILAGGIYLLIKRCITWHVPVAFLASSWIFGLIFYLADPQTYASPNFHLLTGGIFLGAFFLATDRTGTVPVTSRGKIMFGVGCGVMTMIIRSWGVYMDGVLFAILIMNAFVPLLNRMRPKVYGRVIEGA
jgi:electron transport complex protein RnfD